MAPDPLLMLGVRAACSAPTSFRSASLPIKPSGEWRRPRWASTEISRSAGLTATRATTSAPAHATTISMILSCRSPRPPPASASSAASATTGSAVTGGELREAGLSARVASPASVASLAPLPDDMQVPDHRPEADQDGEKPEGPARATTQPGHVDGNDGGDHDLLGEQPRHSPPGDHGGAERVALRPIIRKREHRRGRVSEL